MSYLFPYLSAAGVALVCGLDRTAAVQMMLSRPLVAAPLTGLVLGEAGTGLLVGSVLELLWLSRLPVGASVPHDETQVAVGATALAIVLPTELQVQGGGVTFLCLLTVMPFSKVGQYFERRVRLCNNRLQELGTEAAASGDTLRLERLHLTGLLYFALAALASYAVIVLAGEALVRLLAPVLLVAAGATQPWLKFGMILVGVGALLRTMNVRHAYWLFILGFVATLAVMGAVR